MFRVKPAKREDLVEAFLETQKARKKPAAAARDGDALRPFAAEMKDAALATIGTERVEKLLRRHTLERGRSPRTFNVWRGAMLAFWSGAIARRHATHSPVTAVKRLSEPERRARFLSREEIDESLAAARDTHLELPVALGVLAGLRAGEIARLRWKDVALEGKLLRIVGAKNARGGTKSRVVPIGKRLDAGLRRRMGDQGDDDLVAPNTGSVSWLARPRAAARGSRGR